MNDSEGLGTFLNLMTDFGFKRLFGSEQYKSVLIRLLNTMFGKEGICVADVVFHDKEVLPSGPDGKRIVYDVYCTLPENKEHFIVEMQQVYHANFEKRVVYYISKAFSTQGVSGDNYAYSPVYGLFFVDFQFKHLGHRLVHDFRLMEMETREVFSNHLRLLIVCLNETKRTWEECETELEKTTFIIKNMHLMDKKSKAYMSGEYDDMFNAAEIGSMAHDEVVAYRQSKRAYEDMKLYREGGYADGEEYGIQKGRAEGREEGRAEGREEAMEFVAANLIKSGFPDNVILDTTGLSAERLAEIKAKNK